MIEIKEPTKIDVIEIIEGLLSKKCKREEIVEWQKKVCQTFDYYGPGVLFVPLKNEEGYWFFVSFAILLEKNKVIEQDEYFIRDKDLQTWLNDLKGIKAENLDAQIKNVKVTSKEDWKRLICLVRFNDKDNTVSDKDKSFNFERGILDNLGDMTEEALFEYKNFRFGLQKSYQHFPGWTHLAGEENVPAVIITDLLEYLGVEFENLIDVNTILYKPLHNLVRMDDNGLTYVIYDHITYIEAFLRQKAFEKFTHKQTYWIE